MSSSFGQFDITMAPKPSAYWYQANWGVLATPGSGGVVVRIVTLLDGIEPDRATGALTVTALLTTPLAQLWVDGVPGEIRAVGDPGQAMPFVLDGADARRVANLTLLGIAANKSVVGILDMGMILIII